MSGTPILYVEDNAANFELARKILEHGGEYKVVGATTGEAGLALARVTPPALVLVDLDLPGIDGFEFARRFSAESRLTGIPMIALSASVMKHEREQALAAGCVRFLEKPFDIHELREAVDQAIRRSRR